MDNQTSHHKKQDEGFNFDEQQAGFVMGAVMGALVGGAAALLLSPKSGKEMREIVKKYSKELEQEAHELARDARGTATSLKSVLQEGATEVMEQAPEKIEQAGYQAQQLADELSQRFDSARDVVAELAEAFRSGWEEYGENLPEDELSAAPALLHEDDEIIEEKQEVEDRPEPKPEPKPTLSNFDDLPEEDEIEEKVHPVTPLQARRRSHSGSAYSMHTPSVDEQEKDTQESEVVAHHESRNDKEDDSPKRSLATPGYTTRILDEPKKVEPAKPRVKVEEPEVKKPASEPKKKLLFRRSSK